MQVRAGKSEGLSKGDVSFPHHLPIACAWSNHLVFGRPYAVWVEARRLLVCQSTIGRFDYRQKIGKFDVRFWINRCDISDLPQTKYLSDTGAYLAHSLSLYSPVMRSHRRAANIYMRSCLSMDRAVVSRGADSLVKDNARIHITRRWIFSLAEALIYLHQVSMAGQEERRKLNDCSGRTEGVWTFRLPYLFYVCLCCEPVLAIVR